MFYYLPESLRKWSANPTNLKGKLFPGDPTVAIPKAVEWVNHEIHKGHQSANINVRQEKPFSQDSIIAIGDVVSKGLLELVLANPRIKYCFFDNKTQRDEIISLISDAKRSQRQFSNPAGAVSQEIFDFLEATWKDDSTYMIEINGEEDMIVVAAVLKCDTSFIFYGQPPLPFFNPPVPAGCVVIKVDPPVQSYFQEIFTQMKSQNEV